MPYTIETKDGIIIRNIPDEIDPNSQTLRDRVNRERTQRDTPEMTTGERIQGTLEAGAAIATAGLLEPIAGLYGLGGALSDPFGEEGEAAERVRQVQALGFEAGPAGQKVIRGVADWFKEVTPPYIQQKLVELGEGFENIKEKTFQTYGPAAATVVATTPAAILEAIPGFYAIKQARRLPTTRADLAIETAREASPAPPADSIKAITPVESLSTEDLVKLIQDKKTKRIFEQIKPDDEIIEASARLGVDLNPSHYSTNQRYIEVEQALKANPESPLSAIEQAAIAKLGEQSDDLIKKMGGSIDRGVVDQNVLDEMNDIIKKLEQDAEISYAKVNQVVPANTRVQTPASKAYVLQRLDDFGGDLKLFNKFAPARDMNNSLRPRLDPETKTAVYPTYGALDQIRRDVGDAMNKKQGPYADFDKGQLDQAYSVLIEDQQGVADAFGVGEEFALGRNLVSKRKIIEKQNQMLFGKQLTGSLVGPIRTAAGKMTTGDVRAFQKIIKAAPANQRQAIAASVIDNLFSLGARTQRGFGKGFVNAFEGLNRNPIAKNELFKYLPKRARKRFDDLGKVATGLFRAKAFENVPRTSSAIIQNFKNPEFLVNMVNKITGIMGGIPGMRGVGNVVSGFLKMGENKALDDAIQLIASPEFREAIESFVKAEGRRSARADKILQASKAFKRIAQGAEPRLLGAIGAMGFIPWLLRESPGEIQLREAPE